MFLIKEFDKIIQKLKQSFLFRSQSLTFTNNFQISPTYDK